MSAPLDASAAKALADRVSSLLADAGTRQLVCVVTGVADLTTVDLLARLHLDARRHGVRLTVRGTDDDLMGLLQLTGLADVLDTEPGGG